MEDSAIVILLSLDSSSILTTCFTGRGESHLAPSSPYSISHDPIASLSDNYLNEPDNYLSTFDPVLRCRITTLMSRITTLVPLKTRIRSNAG